MIPQGQVVNANVFDFLIKHPELIPKEWQYHNIYFWGTIFRVRGIHPQYDSLHVRYLYWDTGHWSRNDGKPYWRGFTHFMNVCSSYWGPLHPALIYKIAYRTLVPN
jgi:hypothetical protein